jgi:hypothetical protein
MKKSGLLNKNDLPFRKSQRKRLSERQKEAWKTQRLLLDREIKIKWRRMF